MSHGTVGFIPAPLSHRLQVGLRDAIGVNDSR